MRFVIGDIHGAYLALIQVLDRAKFNFETDQLISLGDVCDGWPNTAGCIETLLKIKNLILIRGNHDVWTSDAYLNKLSKDDMHIWQYYGGNETVKSFKENPTRIKTYIEFLGKAENYHLTDMGELFVHAGIHPNLELNDQPVEDFYLSRKMWTDTITSRLPIPHFKHIYIGHTPTHSVFKDGLPVTIANVTNMDTGAAFTGKLSMMNLDTKQIFQSDDVPSLYPMHSGRNKI